MNMISLSEIHATGLPLEDHGAIAAALSVGRTKLVPTEIGVGLVLETLGLSEGNALLDLIQQTPDFRHVWPLLEQGRLRADSDLVRNTLDQLAVGGVISQAAADAIKGLAVKDDTVTGLQVARVLEGAE